MTICFFGIYNPEYSRNRVLISGFKKNGCKIFECRVDPKVGKIKKFINLHKEYKKIKHNKFDYVIVAFPGHSVVWLAWLLFGKKIIFDAFVSLYNSNVEDRKLYGSFSLWGVRDWLLDWYSCKLSKKILLDTNEHINYFSKIFNINKNKFIRVFVGTDDSVFYPRNNKYDDKFIVHFHGSYIPLQGVEYIIESAKKLENEKDIVFNIIGSKIKKKYFDKSYKNINFIDNVSYNKLPEYINESDICLGIFGDTPKTEMVIPNKIFEAIAMKKPVITADTLAIKELFIDGENILLCRPADSYDLAEKIIKFKNDKILRLRIANNAYKLFQEKLLPQLIVKHFFKSIEK